MNDKCLNKITNLQIEKLFQVTKFVKRKKGFLYFEKGNCCLQKLIICYDGLLKLNDAVLKEDKIFGSTFFDKMCVNYKFKGDVKVHKAGTFGEIYYCDL